MMKIGIFLLLTVICYTNGTPLQRSEIAKPAADPINYRLPRSVIPKDYFLLLHPDFETFNFTGYVEINVNVNQPTRNITFHSKNIRFLATQVINQTANVKIEKEESDTVRDFRILHFNHDIVPGVYALKINYTGTLGSWTQNGFYKTSYTDSNGKVHWLAVSHFEPTYARMAFPCFDEPALKANFTIHIRRQSNYNSISNMPMTRTIVSTNYHEDVFATSVKMPTYLVAFAVSDFKNVSLNRHRVFAKPDAINAGDGKIALDLGIETLYQLEKYTGVNFSLPKMDQIALPEFPAGAMENWGLVTYRDYALLHNTTHNAVSDKQGVLSIIAHEFTHQWFGDLVSPTWWNYIWLNEGFASYYASYISDKVKPQWRVNDQHVINTCQMVFNGDSRPDTRPMTSDAGSPSEISSLFDNIAYAKSGCVLRMLQHAITDNVFRDGLNKYLLAKQYSAANSLDLWDNIQKAVNQTNLNLSIPVIMKTWEVQKGYPLITVNRNYSTGLVTLTQKHYLENVGLPSDSSQWYVPINFATNKQLNFTNTAATHWLLPNRSLTLNVSSSDWLLINKQQTGYYRVNYDDKNWNLLANYLDTDNFDNIHSVSRAQLINDAFSLAYHKRLNYTVALQLIKYLHRETDYIALSAFFTVLPNFKSIASAAVNYTLLEGFLADALNKSMVKLGVSENSNEDKDFVDNKNRVNVVSYACEFGNKNCWSKATAALANIKSVSLLLQDTVFCAGLRGANEAVWFKVYNQSLTEKDSSLRSKLSAALGCSRNTLTLTNYIEMSLAKNQSVFENIYKRGDYFGVQFTFDYLWKNIEKIYKELSGKTGNLITGVATYLNTDEQLKKLVILQSANKHPQLDNYFKTAVEKVKANILTTSYYVNDISRWISNELTNK